MSADIDAHVTNQYEINKRIGKGVSFADKHDTMVIVYNSQRCNV